jgi:hypothetical protein
MRSAVHTEHPKFGQEIIRSLRTFSLCNPILMFQISEEDKKDFATLALPFQAPIRDFPLFQHVCGKTITAAGTPAA